MENDAQVGDKLAMENDAQFASDVPLEPGTPYRPEDLEAESRESFLATKKPQEAAEPEQAAQAEVVAEADPDEPDDAEEPAEDQQEDDDAEAQGKAAADAGEPRVNPFDGRTAKGKAWSRGYDSAAE